MISLLRDDRDIAENHQKLSSVRLATSHCSRHDKKNDGFIDLEGIAKFHPHLFFQVTKNPQFMECLQKHTLIVALRQTLGN